MPSVKRQSYQQDQKLLHAIDVEDDV